MSTITVSHYSDILCVWAYVSQARLHELQEQFGAEIELDYHFVSVFGSIPKKIEKGWGHRGGAAGYGKHVLGVGQRFPHLVLHEDVWAACVPQSSMPAHAFLAAVRLACAAEGEGNQRLADAASTLRQAFFAECRDISDRRVLMEIAEELGLSREKIAAELDSGRAYTVLHDDFERCREQGIRVSPTLLFNEGRQRLTGNVGYRVIEANIRELLNEGAEAEQASWC